MLKSISSRYTVVLLIICAILPLSAILLRSVDSLRVQTSGSPTYISEKTFPNGYSLKTGSKYKYPDGSDGGILDYLQTLESREANDSGDIEVAAWRAIDKNLQQIVNTSSKLTMLDAGCGQGRLLVKYCTSMFHHCTGIDADEFRLQSTKDTLQSLKTENISHKVSLVPIGADLFHSDQRFDFILNSMVIQHVSNETSQRILKNLLHHLQPNRGIFIVLTTYFPKVQSFYQRQCLNKSVCRADTEPITQAQFEELVAHPHKDYLPVKLWSEKELKGLLTSLDCDVIDSFQFTYNKKTSVKSTEKPEEFQRKRGLTMEEYIASPISQGVVCKKKKGE